MRLALATILTLLVPPVGASWFVGGPTHEGFTAQTPLPNSLQMRNVGGSDGAGLCVFTSIAHAARWQNVTALEDFQAFMRRYPGGGWPDKVDQMVKRLCTEKGVAVPAYVQVEGRDLDVIQAALDSGRMVSVTYSYSRTGRYGGGVIAHMVNAVGMNSDWVVILDNNYIGLNNLEWVPRREFLGTYAYWQQSGWSVILLGYGPPPAPVE